MKVSAFTMPARLAVVRVVVVIVEVIRGEAVLDVKGAVVEASMEVIAAVVVLQRLAHQMLLVSSCVVQVCILVCR
jgi:hypothetical protein